MVKADLAGMVSGLEGLASGEAEAIVDAIFETMIAAIQSGDKIEIRGFGSFRIRQRNPRIGRNPRTGQRVEVQAKRISYFKPSKDLLDLINP
jgi:integration host factor subunit beta